MLGADPPLAAAGDIEIPRCVASADEAIALLRECHAAWLDKKQHVSSSRLAHAGGAAAEP